MKDKKLAIIITHPIQYFAPMFRCWAKEIELEVLYCHNPSDEEIGKSGFGEKFQWDVDLLSGYSHTFLKNRAKDIDLSSFSGVDVPNIGEAIKKSKATHVLIMGWHCKAYLQARKYCNKNKIPVASRGDSILNSNIPFYKKIAKKIYYPYFLNKFDKHFYVGQRNKAYLKYYGVKEEKLLYSPHAVDQDFWKPTTKKTNEKFTFIWVGKFIEKKRPTDVINAFLKLGKELGSAAVQLNMIGTGELLEKAKVAAGNSKNIHFLGFKNQTELKAEYQNADCLILSSQNLSYDMETWGLVVNEAFSMHIPAIVSKDCGCSDDMIIEEKTGYVFSSGNIDELKEKMKLIYKKLQQIPCFFDAEIEKVNKIHHFESSISSLKEFINSPLLSIW